MMTFKPYSQWKGSLGEYLQIGDTTDEEMYWYFVNVLPPVTDHFGCVQVGEPINHVNGRPTYLTLKRITADTWKYCGECYRGEVTEPVYGEYNDGLYSIRFLPKNACLVLYDNGEEVDCKFFSKYAYDNHIFNRQDMKFQAQVMAKQNGVRAYELDLSSF